MDSTISMTLNDWLTILAICVGPILAVQAARFLDNRKEARERKLSIFKALMATRAYAVSWDHVHALNRIDLEFSQKNTKEKAVIEAWKAYLDHLNATATANPNWFDKRTDLLVELLHKMSRVLGYDFDKTHIKNSSYSPQAHGNQEQEQLAIRQLSLDVLSGKRAVKIEVVPDED